MKDLSILIPTIPSRIESYSNLIKTLNQQILSNNLHDRIQILSICDTKDIILGKKRNLLLEMSSSKYICFIDDDDSISNTYIKSIVDGIETDPDIVTFCGNYYHNGNFYKPFSLSIKNKYNYEDEFMFYRLPNHVCCIKREIAINCPFANISFGEDTDYANKILPFINIEYYIDNKLYNYHYYDDLSHTRPENNLNPFG